ncbi:hypothetical protein SAMN05216463_103222 [Xylanibacter ruminicola]|uniref:Uncharacterized protein n=1 Tax=Xylanibacter ruminicola TaxID=839 RepID=A0A1M6SJE0_XYLRU|nr:hypothetical protein SAMN05216463_103222 [Xylanibacter ruminicola]
MISRFVMLKINLHHNINRNIYLLELWGIKRNRQKGFNMVTRNFIG